MGTKATRKDFYMEIKRSLGRFLSIFFIVALGVAFFSGIRSSEPDMRVTGDTYFDAADLMDIKAVSTLGITEKDVRAMKKVDGVKSAGGAYSADFLCEGEDRQIVMHVMSLSDTMNKVTVTKGRLPEKPGECLADDEMNYKIGDTITLESGSDVPVTDTLKTGTLKVVGIGNSPCYLSFSRGNTTIGTGTISGFFIVPESSFVLDVYTEAYVTVDGAKELTAYTEEYDKKIDKTIDKIEKITGERSKLRKQELVDEANEELDKARQELADGKAQADQELSDAANTLTDGEAQIADAKAQLSDGRKQIETAKSTLSSKQKELDSALGQYNAGLGQLNEGKAAYQQGQQEYESQRAQYEPLIQSGREQLSQARAQLDENQQIYQGLLKAIEEMTQAGQEGDELEALKAQAGQMKAGLDAGEQSYQEEMAKLDEYQKQLDGGAASLAENKAKLDASEAQLQSALAQIQSGQSQINSGWSEIKKQEAALISGENELAEKEAELNDGRQKYEEAKAESETKLADGEQKIKDAEKEIAKIKNPKWYLYDRSTLPEYTGYGDNADRMKAIGKVFPVLFFLVAALISLTSMTRMVEEQRTEIGTMKALGYDKITIASKYLGYALLATVGGSICGVLIGEKILPYIIIYSYQIMYHHLPEILTPYNLGYAVFATLAAVACTMLATLAACYKELAAQPAVLMRPPSPKIGKRVLLERVPIIWKHLNFTWKSTVRNLMRYKKRFYMTVFGIGGCMALMLVGFGLKDSIFDIANLQYAQIQVYDGNAYLEEDITDEGRESIKDFMEEEPDIERFKIVNMKNITLVNGKNEREAYECVPQDLKDLDKFIHFRNRMNHGKYILSDKGVIVSEKTAKLLDAKVGDTIYIKNEEDGNKPVVIAEICENYMGHYIYISPGYYKQIYGEEPQYNSIFFKAKDGLTKKELEKTGQDILSEAEVMSISYLHDVQKQLDDMLKTLNLVIVVLIVSAGMLAFVVLYNLNNINITERQRELATIKVLGFYDPEVAAYVYRENIILTLIGACAGMVMGRVLHLFVVRTAEVDAVMFGRNINFPSYIYSILFTIAFSAFVNWVMYFKLKKIDMVESLKSIE